LPTADRALSQRATALVRWLAHLERRAAVKSSWIGLFLILAACAAPSAAEAAFVTPAWTRPANDGQAAADQTTFQQWNVFTAVAGPNVPDVAEVNPSGVANAYDANSAASGAFVTGGGNLYSFAGVIMPHATVPGYGTGQTTDFLVQVLVQGSEITVDDLTLGGIQVSTLAGYSYSETSRVSLGGFGGFAIEHAWTFTAPADLATFQLQWGWGPTSASLDQIAIDTHTSPAPEPGTLAMAGVGLVGLVFAARRRRSGQFVQTAQE
jgi:hypothetical protein